MIYRPRIEEDYFDVEDDEPQREDVVARVELTPRRSLGLDAALVGRVFDRVRILGPPLYSEEKVGHDEREGGEGKAEQDKQSDPSIVLRNHRAAPSADVPRAGPPAAIRTLRECPDWMPKRASRDRRECNTGPRWAQ